VSDREPFAGRFGTVGAVLCFALATIGAVQFLRPEGDLATAPLANLAHAIAPAKALPPSNRVRAIAVRPIRIIENLPKPLIIFKAPYPCFPSTGCQRLPSCGLQGSLLECG